MVCWGIGVASAGHLGAEFNQNARLSQSPQLLCILALQPLVGRGGSCENQPRPWVSAELDLGEVVCKAKGPCVASARHDHAQRLARAWKHLQQPSGCLVALLHPTCYRDVLLRHTCLGSTGAGQQLLQRS